MIVEALPVGPVQANCYLVADDQTRRALIVDPGEEAARILARIHDLGLIPEAIVATHAHFDHVGAVRRVREATGVPFLAHEDEQETVAAAADRAGLFGLAIDPPPVPDRLLRDGEEVTVGALRFRVAHAPGHSPGHIVLIGEGVAFVGDVIFAGSIGRTDLPGQDTPTLLRSIVRHILSLPDDAVLYPGHGPRTTVGQERATNPFVQSLRR